MLEILLHTIKDRVQTTIRRECGNTGRHRFNTSDVVQESLIQIWMSLSEAQISELVDCNSWLRKIALGHRAKLKRKHLAKKRSMFNEVYVTEEHSSHSVNPAERLQHFEQVNLVMKEVGRLPAIDKEIVVRYIFQDEAFLMIASNLGKDAQFVRRHFRKAIQFLKQRLSDQGIQFEE